MLAHHWPGVPAKHTNAVRRAIALAEQSASEASAVGGLEDAAMDAVVAAGAALATWPGMAKGESRPENAYAGTIASFVAKAAEKAAEAARADADDSGPIAAEAWALATDAAVSAEEKAIAQNLREDLTKLFRTAIRKKWTNSTRVPPEIWSVL